MAPRPRGRCSIPQPLSTQNTPSLTLATVPVVISNLTRKNEKQTNKPTKPTFKCGVETPRPTFTHTLQREVRGLADVAGALHQ